MIDIALRQTSAPGLPPVFDIALDGFDLTADKGLRTAVMLLLFLDAQADVSEVDEGEDRRGWWADPTLGSKLWLLTRAKASPDTLARARRYAEAALAWLVKEGAAQKVLVESEWVQPGLLGLRIVILLATGKIWDEVFEFSTGG
jgi:phage gp46-like protein